MVTKKALKANYQNQATHKKESQYDMIKKLELDIHTHKKLIDYSNKKIMFLSSPFDLDSIDLLNDLGLKYLRSQVEKLRIYPI